LAVHFGVLDSTASKPIASAGVLREGSRGYLRYRARIFQKGPKFWKFCELYWISWAIFI